MGIFDKISGRFGDILDEVRTPEDLHRVHETAIALVDSDPDQAIALLTSTLSRHPSVQRTFVLLARAYRNKNQTRAAIDALENALKVRETSSLHLQAGELYERLRQWRAAEQHLLTAATLPDSKDIEFEIAYALGRTFEAQRRRDRAEREYERALELSSGSLEVGHRLVRLLIQRDTNLAREKLRQIDRDQIDPLTHLLWALIAEREGDIAAARESVGLCLEHIDDPEARVTAARLANQDGDATEALRLLEGLSALADGDLANASLHEKGRAYATLGQFEEAKVAYSDLLTRRPEDPEALLGRGVAELELGQYEVASGFFLQALAHPISKARALLGIGRALIGQGEFDRARHYFDEALRAHLGPEDVGIANLELARLACSASDFVEALRYVQVAGRSEKSAERASELESQIAERLKPQFRFPQDRTNPMAIEGLLRQCVSWAAGEPALSGFLPRLQGLVQKMDSPLSLAVVGEFNAGKSTLLNALLEEDLLPVGVLPTTAHTGIVRFGPRRAARLHLVDEESREVDFLEAARVMKDNAAQVERVEFMFPHPVLRTVEFWDTPGFNALEERHETVAANALENAEAILWVMDANQVLSATEFDRIDGLRNSAERLIIVINKVDRLGRERESRIRELIEYIDDNIGEQVAGVFALSAQEAVSDRSIPNAPLEDFRSYLDKQVIKRSGGIKVAEVTFCLRQITAEIHNYMQQRIAGSQSTQTALADLAEWLHKDAIVCFDKAIEASQRELDDRLTFLLDSIEHEIAEALRPAGQFISRPALSEADASFVGRLFAERFNDVLQTVYLDVSRTLDDLESEFSRNFETALQPLPVSDRHTFRWRLESHFAGLSLLRSLLEERFVERSVARVLANLEMVGSDTFIYLGQDRSLWRAKLRRLLPDKPDREVRTWQKQWHARMFEFVDAVKLEVRWSMTRTAHQLDVTLLREWLSEHSLQFT